MIDFETAFCRERLTAETASGICRKDTFERLYSLSYKSIVKSTPFYSDFRLEELLDAVFGSSVLLCATGGKTVSTEISGEMKISDNKRALEFLLFSVIADLTEMCSKSLFVSAVIESGLLTVVFKTDRAVNFNNRFVALLKTANAQLIKSKGDTDKIILKKQLKNGSGETAVLVKDYEYVEDPFSTASVCLRRVSLNPVFFNDTLGNSYSVNRR